MYALGRGVRGVREALAHSGQSAMPDPARAKDITPKQQETGAVTGASQSIDAGPGTPAAPRPPTPLVLGKRPLIMGVVNVTPDSFSDGGHYLDAGKAIKHAMQLAAEGADILDIGGESTRPGYVPVSADEEIQRILPVVAGLAAQTSLPLSIDTMKSRTAAEAIQAGASIVNDVWGFQFDPDIAKVTADAGASCVLMHNRERDDPSIDIFEDVRGFLSRSVEIALAAGVAQERIIIDPGIGFGKTNDQSLEMIRRLGELKRHFGLPVLLGLSRKRVIGHATGRVSGAQRDAGSVAGHIFGLLQGADIVRVHNAAMHADALAVLNAITAGNYGKLVPAGRTGASKCGNGDV